MAKAKGRGEKGREGPPSLRGKKRRKQKGGKGVGVEWKNKKEGGEEERGKNKGGKRRETKGKKKKKGKQLKKG